MTSRRPLVRLNGDYAQLPVGDTVSWDLLDSVPANLLDWAGESVDNYTPTADLGSAAFLDAGVANGVASLGADGKLPSNQLPALAITETFVVNTEAAMLALDAQQGDVAVRTDLQKSFILTAEPATTLGNWQELLTPTGSGGTVTSVGISGSAGLSVSGSPITSSGTITINLSANLQSWSAIPPEAKANLAGAAFTGVVSTSSYITGLTNNPYRLGYGSANATQGFISWHTAADTTTRTGYIGFGSAGTDILTIANEAGGPTRILGGVFQLYTAGSQFHRAAANSNTLTSQPRIFVGGSDPGAAAANGDIWIP